MNFPSVMLFILFALIVLILGSVINGYIKNKKYPYLRDRFLRTLSYSDQTQVIKISDKLELHLENDFILSVKVMVKNEQGEFVKVESRSFYRPKSEPIRFEEPWHDEIANSLKRIYEEREQKEQKAEEKKQLEIQKIKTNWK